MPGRATSHPMGETSARETFGHNGSNACVARADPTRRLAVAYLTGLLPAGLDRARHPSEVSDAILAAHGAAGTRGAAHPDRPAHTPGPPHSRTPFLGI